MPNWMWHAAPFPEGHRDGVSLVQPLSGGRLRWLDGQATQTTAVLEPDPCPVKDQIVELALAHPEKSPRQIAWLFTDHQGYFVSELSAYRILKGFDLVQSPVFQMVPAREKFEKPTQRVHELWQTDFTQFKVFNHWGWYYLSSILDDYSRYIIAWRLSSSMGSDDVEETLKMALDKAGLETARVRHRPGSSSPGARGSGGDQGSRRTFQGFSWCSGMVIT